MRTFLLLTALMVVLSSAVAAGPPPTPQIPPGASKLTAAWLEGQWPALEFPKKFPKANPGMTTDTIKAGCRALCAYRQYTVKSPHTETRDGRKTTAFLSEATARAYRASVIKAGRDANLFAIQNNKGLTKAGVTPMPITPELNKGFDPALIDMSLYNFCSWIEIDPETGKPSPFGCWEWMNFGWATADYATAKKSLVKHSAKLPQDADYTHTFFLVTEWKNAVKLPKRRDTLGFP